MEIYNFNQFALLEKSIFSKFNLPKKLIRKIHRVGITHDSEYKELKTKKEVREALKSSPWDDDRSRLVLIINHNIETNDQIMDFLKTGSLSKLETPPYCGIIYFDGYKYDLFAFKGEEIISERGNPNDILRLVPNKSQYYSLTDFSKNIRYRREENKNWDKYDFLDYFSKNIGKYLEEKNLKEYRKLENKILKKVRKLTLDDIKSGKMKDLEYEANKIPKPELPLFILYGRWIKNYDSVIRNGRIESDITNLINNEGIDQVCHLFAKYIVKNHLI